MTAYANASSFCESLALLCASSGPLSRSQNFAETLLSEPLNTWTWGGSPESFENQPIANPSA